MLRFFRTDGRHLHAIEPSEGEVLPDNAVWIDLAEPTRDEERALEEALGIGVPTREDVTEIQTSSRLLEEDGTLFMTGIVPYGEDRRPLQTLPLTFIRTGDRLITIRYGFPESVDRFIRRAADGKLRLDSADAVLAAIVEAIVDRIADRLEFIGDDLRRIERLIFRRGTQHAPVGRRLSLGRRIRELQVAIESLGAHHQVIFEMRGCLQSFVRLLGFRRSHHGDIPCAARFAAIEEDLKAIADYDADLTASMEFMLDATVGLIDVQQNKVIYILSIVGMVLTPPVLIASLYGMNFVDMPELKWAWGYAWALLLMLASAVVPYLLFKWKGWL
jgi:magnesium transporter